MHKNLTVIGEREKKKMSKEKQMEIQKAIEELGRDDVQQFCGTIITDDTRRVIMTGETEQMVLAICLQILSLAFKEYKVTPEIRLQDMRKIAIATIDELTEKMIDDGVLNEEDEEPQF